MTYQEIGDSLGISHQAAWEIEKRAISKINKRLAELGITIEDVSGSIILEAISC